VIVKRIKNIFDKNSIEGDDDKGQSSNVEFNPVIEKSTIHEESNFEEKVDEDLGESNDEDVD
jgi:hypothetical protein